MRLNNNQSGFTLIELVMIIVILGILAEAAARSSLGSIRSGITIFYANQAVTTGTATWPTLSELETANTVMAQLLPANPYQLSTNAPDSLVTGVTKGTIVGTRGGWAYHAASGEIWPNTSSIGENNW